MATKVKNTVTSPKEKEVDRGSKGLAAYSSTGATKLRRLKERYDAGKIPKPIYDVLVKKYGGTVEDTKEGTLDWGQQLEQAIENQKTRKAVAKNRKETEEELDIKRGKKKTNLKKELQAQAREALIDQFDFDPGE